MRTLRSTVAIVAFAIFLGSAHAQSSNTSPNAAPMTPVALPPIATYELVLQNARDAHPGVPGVYASVCSSDNPDCWTGAAGAESVRTGRLNSTFRVASVSKLFVAVAVLRLWEEGRLNLDDPVERWLPPELTAPLLRGGYDVHAITVRTLLAHTAGVRDATQDYYLEVLQHPRRRWTAAEQIEFAVARGGPLAAPGVRYEYSDIGYLLVGEIVKSASGQPLDEAVRRLDRFEELGLTSTYFEGLERPPASAGVRSRQHIDFEGFELEQALTAATGRRRRINAVDVTNWDATYDPYGASGIVSSSTDLALFVRGIFEGRMFDRTETLVLAMEPTIVSVDSEVRPSTTLIFERFTASGVTCWGKEGWYSVFVEYCPETRTAIAVTAIDATSAGWNASRVALEGLAAIPVR